MLPKRESRRKREGGVATALILAVLFCSGPAAGQDKEEPPAVTSSRSFRLSGYAQFLYIYYEKGIDTFSIPRARLSLDGTLVKNLRYRLTADAVKSPALIDAMLDFQFKPYLGLRVGQYYVPFSLESTTSDSELDVIYRSQAVIALAPGRDIGAQGRDIGAMLTGKTSIVEYFVGIFNGAGINRLDTNKNKDVSARVILRPVAALAVGGSLYGGQYSASEGVTPVTRNRAGLEGRLTLGAFCLKSEFISAEDERTSKSGWYIQGTYDIVPGRFQAVVKWDAFDPNRDLSADRNDVLTLGGTWFIWQKTKLMVNYSLARKEGEGTTNQFFAIQFQAGF
jgi:phosphate-selective porin